MYKFILTTLLAIIGVSLHAQEAYTTSEVIKETGNPVQVDITQCPIKALVATPDINVALVTSTKSVVEANVSWNWNKLSSLSTLNIDNTKYITKGVDYGLYRKYYFKPKRGSDGFYGGVYARGNTHTYTSKNSGNGSQVSSDGVVIDDGVKIIKHREVNTGLSLGHKWVNSKHLIFDLSGGIGRKVFQRNTIRAGTVNPDKIPSTSLDWFLRFYMGYRIGGRK